MDRNDPEGNGHPTRGLVASAARVHVLYLWFAVAGLLISNILYASLLKDLRQRTDGIELREACRSRGCRDSVHPEDCVDSCVEALRR